MNKHVKKYLRRVRGWLPCRRRMKNDIMAQVTERVEEWAGENPGCTYPELEAHFGAPGEIAAAYIENVGAEELLRDLHIKRKIATAVSIAMVTAVLVWAIGVTVTVVDAMVETHSRKVETVTTVYDG